MTPEVSLFHAPAPVPRRLAIVALLAGLAWGGAPRAQEVLGEGERNLFEWIQVAPIVVVGRHLGDDGKLHVIQVLETIRGDVAVDDELRIDVRYANRNRDRLVDPKAIVLETGGEYVFLLQRAKPRKAKDPEFFRLVRGVHSVRELPGEGRAPFLAALRTFAEVQDRQSEAWTWDFMERSLGETNPLLLDVALEQLLKFRRGTPELLPALRPLLFHPDGRVRAQVLRLIGQILERHPASELADEASLRTELVARARGDRDGDVRVAATEALAHFDPAAVDEVLEEISASDPEQLVRYAATRILVEHRDRKAPPPGTN